MLRATDAIGVKMLCLGDKLSNLRSIYRQRFNRTDPRKHHWYYRSVAEATQEISGYDAWQEFD